MKFVRTYHHLKRVLFKISFTNFAVDPQAIASQMMQLV